MHGMLIVLATLAACTSRQPNKAPVPDRVPPAQPQGQPQLEATDATSKAEEKTPEPRAPVKPEINQRFLDPNLDFDRWKKTFEGESREVYAARQEAIAALKLEPGQSVADIGAGTGFYLWAFAEAVGPRGHVYGVELSPRFLERLRRHVAQNKIDNATIVTGTARSVELLEDSVDLVFICDTYHHFEYPQTILASIGRALRPGGALVVIDFHRIEGKSSNWVLDHVRAGQEEFRSEIEAAGFVFDGDVEMSGFSENYMMRFRISE